MSGPKTRSIVLYHGKNPTISKTLSPEKRMPYDWEYNEYAKSRRKKRTAQRKQVRRINNQVSQANKSRHEAAMKAIKTKHSKIIGGITQRSKRRRGYQDVPR